MKTIVVVDDNELFLSKLMDFLEQQKDLNCKAFSNPENALQYVLNEKEIDTVISDFEMQKMSGLRLAEQIIEKRPTTRIIVMSGHSTNYLRKIALKAGIDENKIQLFCNYFLNDLVTLLNN